MSDGNGFEKCDRFAETATEYCYLIENHSDLTTDEFLQRVRKLLPRLYLQAVELPYGDFIDDCDEPEITHEAWGVIFSGLHSRLGRRDDHRTVFDPILANDYPHISFLSDDLADIWRDLKASIEQWNSLVAANQQDAVWHWKFKFETHWGEHLVDALRAIELQQSTYPTNT